MMMTCVAAVLLLAAMAGGAAGECALPNGLEFVFKGGVPDKTYYIHLETSTALWSWPSAEGLGSHAIMRLEAVPGKECVFKVRNRRYPDNYLHAFPSGGEPVFLFNIPSNDYPQVNLLDMSGSSFWSLYGYRRVEEWRFVKVPGRPMTYRVQGTVKNPGKEMQQWGHGNAKGRVHMVPLAPTVWNHWVVRPIRLPGVKAKMDNFAFDMSIESLARQATVNFVGKKCIEIEEEALGVAVTHSLTETVSESYSLSISQALTLGLSVTASVELGFFSASSTVTMETTWETSQEWTTTRDVEFTSGVTVAGEKPGRYRAYMTVKVAKGVRIPFTSQLHLSSKEHGVEFLKEVGLGMGLDILKTEGDSVTFATSGELVASFAVSTFVKSERLDEGEVC